MLRLVLVGAALFPLPVAAFDYEDMVRLIRAEGVTGIEQLLPHLPAEYLENFTLVHDSRSLHGASKDAPRALLFGRDAKLILSFNGEPGQSRYHHLEVMQFRDEARAFELRSVAFEDEGVSFSGKDPEVCLGCHGAVPGPIWSSYEYSADSAVEHWPGFYGATHDAPQLTAGEAEAFARFRDAAAEHPRYRHLRLRHPHSRWYPYGAGPGQHRFRPNNRLGNLLARLNASRLARRVLSGGFFKDYPNLSMLWLLRCEERSEDALHAFVDAAFRRRYPALADAVAAPAGESGGAAGVFERLLSGPGIETWNMSLAPVPGEPRFFTGIVWMDELVAAEVLRSIPAGHWLREYYRPWSQRDLYDTFKAGYYDANVAPGGVGADYEALGTFYDRDRASLACAELARLARSEVEAAGG